jgi:MFS family permease
VIAPLGRQLRSLAIPNYRRYFLGQAISHSGTWMQTVAVGWLVLTLTGSGFALGVSVALQYVPFLLLGPWGGVIADRADKRRLLIHTQIAMAVPAVALWVATGTGLMNVWIVYVCVFLRGAINTLDNPARQTLVAEMVPRDLLVNAVSLNSTLAQIARLVGPALAAITIATTGLATCFLLNAVSFVFTIGALVRMNSDEFQRVPRIQRENGQIRAGLLLAARTAELRGPLVLMAIVGMFSFNFTVTLPLLAKFTFHGTATTYAALTISMAAGALAAALMNGARTTMTARVIALASLLFGLTMAATAAAPDLAVALIALAAVGAASVTFSAAVNSSLQLAVASEMRGRIMSLYTMVYVGTTPMGAALIGWLSASFGPRVGVAAGAGAALVASAIGFWTARRRPAAETAPLLPVGIGD